MYKTKGRIGIVSSKEEFEKYFNNELTPFFKGGIVQSYHRSLAIKYLLEAADKTGNNFSEIVVLDAGCGTGSLST